VSYLTHLECAGCGQKYDPKQPHNLCTCGSPIFARYDLKKIPSVISPEDLLKRDKTIWRYRELLPVDSDENIVTLGEGGTPLISTPNLSSRLGIKHLFFKDESFHPTGSFKARGMAVAVSKAKELGITKICLPSAGNAGSAAAAYGAKAGMEVNVFMPQQVEEIYQQECRAYGAKLTLFGNSILEAGQEMNRRRKNEWFDFSTLKEPYRVEGKKTMGYELAEQLNWTLPDAIFYPTGGGTGLIGMWKAFEEMEQLGWIASFRPKMYVVQAQGCAPLVKAFLEGKPKSELWQNPVTLATGIRVPQALADFLILEIVTESGGKAVAVSETEIQQAFRLAANSEGILLCPEGAAALAALIRLQGLEKNRILFDRPLVFNTGSALKYPQFLKQSLT
jgi:threonine synthase